MFELIVAPDAGVVNSFLRFSSKTGRNRPEKLVLGVPSAACYNGSGPAVRMKQASQEFPAVLFAPELQICGQHPSQSQTAARSALRLRFLRDFWGGSPKPRLGRRPSPRKGLSPLTLFRFALITRFYLRTVSATLLYVRTRSASSAFWA